jgi:midasin (ATPase involved in ribosome maturation)
MNVLWNVHRYYSQFSEAVAARIRDLRLPIEKKLKDCVKIFRWDDISHWAIKEAIKKIHKTLHKHIKQFQVNTFFSHSLPHTKDVIKINDHNY